MATEAVARGPVYIGEPRLARWLFGSSQAAWIWLIARCGWAGSGSSPGGPGLGELTIGVMLILGLFTGLAALLGSILNFSFVFAGSVVLWKLFS